MNSFRGLARPPSLLLHHKIPHKGGGDRLRPIVLGEGLSARKPMKTSGGAAASSHTLSCPFCNLGLSRRGGSSGIP